MYITEVSFAIQRSASDFRLRPFDFIKVGISNSLTATIVPDALTVPRKTCAPAILSPILVAWSMSISLIVHCGLKDGEGEEMMVEVPDPLSLEKMNK